MRFLHLYVPLGLSKSCGCFTLTMLLFVASLLTAPVVADCECGYSTSVNGSTSGAIPHLFTEVIESDFLHIRDVSLDTDWRRQEFSVTPEKGRGPFGMNYTIESVVSNPISNHSQWDGPGINGPGAGLQLMVDSGLPVNGYIKTAQMNSAREDLLWGTYRAGLKLTNVPGTCASFFWYYNDVQEIDIEFLSSSYVPENKTFPINLVLQSEAAKLAGYNAADTGNYIIANLPFDPTDDFHDYRIDFVPGNIVFYADGVVLGRMNTTAVPTNPSPGHMILTHWSNGNPLWSFGPPAKTAVLTVSYVKAYFNSSLPSRISDFQTRCKDPGLQDAVCAIPNNPGHPTQQLDGVPPVPTASNYFFSDDDDKIPGQTVFKKSDGASSYQATGVIVGISYLVILQVVLNALPRW